MWQSAETILPFSCCPLVFLWHYEVYEIHFFGGGGICLCLHRGKHPVLIQHVLTVLVFLVWRPACELCPKASDCDPALAFASWPHSSRVLDLLPLAPQPPLQKRDEQHKLLQHNPERRKLTSWFGEAPPPQLVRQPLRTKRLTNSSKRLSWKMQHFLAKPPH